MTQEQDIGKDIGDAAGARSARNVDERPADAKSALLEAATRLFTAHGYSAVSTRDIAEAAGVNLGSIQYHFGSKAQLFIATVHELMAHAQEVCANLAQPTACRSPESAGRQLCLFIRAFFASQLDPRKPQVCRVIGREIFSGMASDPEMFETLVHTITHEYMKPLEELLVAVIRYLRPEASLSELEWSAQSILGECSHYIVKRPFIERLRGRDLADPTVFREVVEHVARFSMRGLGCSNELIDQAIVSAYGNAEFTSSGHKRKQ